MKWQIIKLDTHNVYSEWSIARVSSRGINFGVHVWFNAITHARIGDYVKVYVLVGALANSNKPAIVLLDNGRVEVWEKN